MHVRTVDFSLKRSKKHSKGYPFGLSLDRMTLFFKNLNEGPKTWIERRNQKLNIVLCVRKSEIRVEEGQGIPFTYR